jgi:hypothetical protein
MDNGRNDCMCPKGEKLTSQQTWKKVRRHLSLGS